jgi:hypothetical protein
MWQPRLSQLLQPPRAVTGIAFPFYLLHTTEDQRTCDWDLHTDEAYQLFHPPYDKNFDFIYQLYFLIIN